jgi:hypothetical protein
MKVIELQFDKKKGIGLCAYIWFENRYVETRNGKIMLFENEEALKSYMLSHFHMLSDKYQIMIQMPSLSTDPADFEYKKSVHIDFERCVWLADGKYNTFEGKDILLKFAPKYEYIPVDCGYITLDGNGVHTSVEDSRSWKETWIKLKKEIIDYNYRSVTYPYYGVRKCMWVENEDFSDIYFRTAAGRLRFMSCTDLYIHNKNSEIKYKFDRNKDCNKSFYVVFEKDPSDDEEILKKTCTDYILWLVDAFRKAGYDIEYSSWKIISSNWKRGE